jgi:hypothetical protein
VFLTALARPRGEREAWVAEECRGDAGLLREVESLLRHHHETVGESIWLDPGDPETPIPQALGDFQVLEVLGRGGMGVVYRAQRGAEPPVALKVLRPGLLTPVLLARFGREAELLARLDHPGISRLLETGVVDGPEGAQPYIAMALVDGQDLRHWAGSPRPLEERLEVLARTCDAVEHAHRQGIVHRDLKPENILVRADGSPCVLDFGVARLTEFDYRATTLMTSAGVLVGTVRYMSPEQADARPGGADARSDVYSLGVVAYELVSGTMPYDVPSDSIHRALVAVLTSPPRPLSHVGGSRGRALEAVIGKALAKPADERYASAAELAAEFRRVAAGQRPHARPRRRTTPLPRFVPLLVVAVLVAFAAGRWLGARNWFRSAAPALGGREAVLTHAIALLDSAATRVHLAPLRVGRLQECIAMSDSARVLLGGLGDRAVGAPLERVAWSLEMEAHFRIADLTLEPGEYEACMAAGLEADRIGWHPDRRGLVRAGAGSLFDELASSRYQQPLGVVAMAASRLGTYSQPLTQQLRALDWNRRALDSLTVGPKRGNHSTNSDPVSGDFARRLLLGERGLILARVAALVDSGPQAAEALRALRASSQAGESDAHPRAAAQWELRYGRAWSVLARIEGRPTAYDSAVTHLERGTRVAHAGQANGTEAEIRLALAEALRWRARTRANRPLARRDLEVAQAALDAPPGEVPGALHPRYEALLRLRRAEVTLDLATLEGSRPLAESALVAMAHTDSLFTPITHPVVCSEIEIERGRANALLWTMTGDRFMREAALRRLEAARPLVTPDDDPGRARRLELGIEALRSGERRSADLWRPVSSGPLTAAQAAVIRRGALVRP